MKIIDLSQPLFDNMPVYPGDPKISIKEIHTLKKEGWNLRDMTFTTHIGTHVNVPYHMVKAGKRLDEYDLSAFFGEAELFHRGMKMSSGRGLIFHDTNMDTKIANLLISDPPKFIGLSAEFEFDIAIEKLLLKHNIISYENLINTKKLPHRFIFYGLPLNIKASDGSPVRACAIVK